MDWFTYALIASVTFSVYSVLIRKLLIGKGEPKIFTILSNFAVATALGVIALFSEFFINLTLLDISLMILTSVFFAIASTLFIYGRQKEEVGVVSIVRETSVIWIFLIGVFVFGEGVSLTKVLGMGLIISGTVLALWKKHFFSFSKGVTVLFLATLSMSIASSISKVFVVDKLSPAAYNMVLFYLASLWIFLFTKDRRNRIKHEIQIYSWKLPVVSSILALSIFLLNKGFQVGEISFVFPVYSSYVIFTILAGIVFLNEKSHMKRKIVGSFIALLGIVLINFMP